LAELQIPGGEPSVIHDSSTATVTLQGCQFDVSAFDADGTFSNIFGVDVGLVRYMVNARKEQLQPVLTKTYSWTTSLTANVTKDGQIRQPFNRTLSVGYRSTHTKGEPVPSVNVTGKFRLTLPASGQTDKRKDQKWPASMQVRKLQHLPTSMLLGCSSLSAEQHTPDVSRLRVKCFATSYIDMPKVRTS
jgi:hypothetical protein